MKIILIEDVKNLGSKGDIKEVAEGYARNFLMPRKLAGMATEASMKNAETRKEKEKEESKRKQEEAENLLKKIRGKKITITSKEKEGKLFGSISAKDIVKELAKENFAIDEKAVKMENPIRKIGNYTIKVVLGKGLEAKLDLAVNPEK
jgi:large subunit ribosomal protein L9